ncbi:MAG: hypothetical protein K0U75_13450, partial [Actinomycetia bacterium]|nr:hypothetical protein [Actinomycetes bacterium]
EFEADDLGGDQPAVHQAVVFAVPDLGHPIRLRSTISRSLSWVLGSPSRKNCRSALTSQHTVVLTFTGAVRN